jgi:hypothetical protein
MKKTILHFIISIVLLLVSTGVSFAQADKPYTDGPLWQVQFIHTKPGMNNLYLKNLSEGWIKQMRAAKEAGLILDYKVFSALPSSENDWDLMLLYELKNYAMLDGFREKMEALSRKVLNADDDGLHAKAMLRNDLRVTQGGKLTQELLFK